jgi:adenylate cyclase
MDRRYRMTATTLCRTCGTELGVSAKFCDECGAPITATIRPAEYKQVTVLFAELFFAKERQTSHG